MTTDKVIEPKKMQVLDINSADDIYWWINDYGDLPRKFWSVIPFNPMRIEVCSRGSVRNEVLIATANIGDWVIQDESGDFYVETNMGARVEPVLQYSLEPTFTLTEVKEAIRADREKLIEKIESNICVEAHTDLRTQLGCNGERYSSEVIVTILRNMSIGESHE